MASVVYMLPDGSIYHRRQGCDAFLGSGLRPTAIDAVPLVAVPCSFCYPTRVPAARIEAETGLTIVYMKPGGGIYHRPSGCDAVVLDRTLRPIRRLANSKRIEPLCRMLQAALIE